MTFPPPSPPDLSPTDAKPLTPAPAPQPASSPSRRGWGLALLGGLLALVVGLAVGEWMGWPILAGPLQRSMSKQLHRTVSLQAVSDGQKDATIPAEDTAQTPASTPASQPVSQPTSKPIAKPAATASANRAANPPSAASALLPAAAPAIAALQDPVPPGFRVRFLGGVHLTAPWLTVAAPDWSAAPYLMQAQDLVLDLRYADLWRAWRGQPLRIQGLQARRLDAHLERQADGRVSWQFGPDRVPDPAVPPPSLPVVERLAVAQGHVQVQDVPDLLSLQAELSVVDAVTPALGSVLQVHGRGQYRGLPLTLALTASGALPGTRMDTRAAAQSDPAVGAPAVPLTLTARIGRASLSFEGSASDPVKLLGLAGRFTLQGPSLAAVGDPLRVTLPTTAAFRSRGRLARRADGWYVLVDDATVGTSQLNGAFAYYTDRAVPLLAGRLGGKRLHLADLGPAVGLALKVPAGAAAATGPLPAGEQTAALTGVLPAPVPAALPASVPASLPASVTAMTPAVRAGLPPATGRAPALVDRRHPGKVLPDRPFDLAALRVMDADVLIDFAEVDLNTRWLEPLRPLRGHLLLAGGVLALRDLDARTAQGRVGGQVQLDGRGSVAQWTADLRWDRVRLESWVHQARANNGAPYISGQLDGRAKLTGQGRSTAEILASLKGSTHTELTGGAISHLAVEAAGLDVAQALGLMVVGDDALPVGCAVADLVADRGVFRPRVMVLDTTDSALWVDGSLSLATETMDLRGVVSPKDFSPLALRSPLHVQGSFANPKLSLELGRLAPRVAASALLALVNPLAALLPLIDTGDTDRAARAAGSCRALMERHTVSAKRPVLGRSQAPKATGAMAPRR